MATDEHLWSLDLDSEQRPWRAHLIVAVAPDRRWTACGQLRTAGTHPRGWWGTSAGRLPLLRVHCGADVIEGAR